MVDFFSNSKSDKYGRFIFWWWYKKIKFYKLKLILYWHLLFTYKLYYQCTEILLGTFIFKSCSAKWTKSCQSNFILSMKPSQIKFLPHLADLVRNFRICTLPNYIKVKVLAFDVPCLDALHVSRGLHSNFPTRNPPENSPNLVSVSSQVNHHLIVMGSGVSLHPTQGQCPSPVLPHRAGTNFTPVMYKLRHCNLQKH